MTKAKKANSIVLKNQIVNILMKSGKKQTGEKILLKFAKSFQKSTTKNFQSLVQLAIINSTPAFKLNEQTLKKGKRKSKKIIPSFIIKDSFRVMTAVKFIKDVACKDKNSLNFYKSFKNEVLDAAAYKGQSIEQKNKLQMQILLNKRYLAKFRW